MVLDKKTSVSLQRLRKEARKYFPYVYSVSSFLEMLGRSSSYNLSSSKRRRQRRKKLLQSKHSDATMASSSQANKNLKFENLRRNLIICCHTCPETNKAADRGQYLTQAEVQIVIVFNIHSNHLFYVTSWWILLSVNLLNQPVQMFYYTEERQLIIVLRYLNSR